MTRRQLLATLAGAIAAPFVPVPKAITVGRRFVTSGFVTYKGAPVMASSIGPHSMLFGVDPSKFVQFVQPGPSCVIREFTIPITDSTGEA